jgi:hypothetical protein
MDQREIAPYNRSWSEVVSGPQAQTMQFAAQAVSEGEHRSRRTPNERRRPHKDPLAYFRRKPVQTMGGSSEFGYTYLIVQSSARAIPNRTLAFLHAIP